MTFRIRFGDHYAIAPLRCPPISNPYARARLRREIEADIERRLDLLDRLDGDPDAEDNGDAEPSLGWLCNGGHSYGDDGRDCELNETEEPA